MVEASSGKVYANMWPAKSETPFRMLFVGSVLAFFAASILSYVIGVVITEDLQTGMVTGEGVKIAAFGFTALPLMFLAYLIAKKV